ncbi:MAG: L,D-transpeptidase family protein [Chitinophagaceae bacterium]
MKKTGLTIIIVIIIASCKQKATHTGIVQRDRSITVNNSYSELFFDSLAVESFIDRKNLHDSTAMHLRNFYNSRNYQYAWFLNEGIADYAATFLGMQNNYIGYSGDSSLYNEVLQKRIDSLQNLKHINPADSFVLNTELLLTGQFLQYTYKAYAGSRDLNTRDLSWYIPRKKIDAVGFLDSLLKNKGQNLSRYEPVNRQYNLLKTYLLKYYEIEKSGSWDSIIADKKSYRTGDSAYSIASIKKRLYHLGDLDENDTTKTFTQTMAGAVKKYQRRYGLKEDGIVGASLLKEMNQPVSIRIRQLLINMERMRWVPAEPATDYLLVNIPEFRLHVFEKGNLAFSMKVVVGSTAHNTVIFNGDMKYIVFSPYWNVPPGIIKNEILPGITRNKNYLASHNMEWNNGNVRQKPGPRNSLGLVKFLFPNSYNIYLHDTPSKSLFNENTRAFSHGCIRIAEPQKLAEFILRNDTTWTREKITKAMKSGKEKYVTLSPTIPVFIGYFTAWVNSKGELNFRDDVYGHDKKMAEQLFTAK